jgi:hypothetical protein
MSKELNSISDAKRSYEKKASKEQQTELLPHSRAYEEKLKKYRHIPSPSERNYGTNDYPRRKE